MHLLLKPLSPLSPLSLPTRSNSYIHPLSLLTRSSNNIHLSLRPIRDIYNVNVVAERSGWLKVGKVLKLQLYPIFRGRCITRKETDFNSQNMTMRCEDFTCRNLYDIKSFFC